MKLVLDLVINHSSDKHKWFRKSVQRIDPYTNFYIWKDPKGYDSNGNPIPPNKWVRNIEFAKNNKLKREA